MGIKVTNADIGRRVRYEQVSIHCGMSEEEEEEEEEEELRTRPRVWEYGVITSYNDRWVFVRYVGDSTSKATSYFDLEYV